MVRSDIVLEDEEDEKETPVVLFSQGAFESKIGFLSDINITDTWECLFAFIIRFVFPWVPCSLCFHALSLKSCLRLH